MRSLRMWAGLVLALGPATGAHAADAVPDFQPHPDACRLLQELRVWFGPVALSGAIVSGRAILAAQAMGADFVRIGSLFIAAQEADATDACKQTIVDSTVSDVVRSNLFTGVHGDDLRPSVVAAGLDPDALPQGDVSQMSFGRGGSSKAKAWRDIWGCGPGIDDVDAVAPAGEMVSRRSREHAQARASLDGVVTLEPANGAFEAVAGGRRDADLRAGVAV